MRQIMESEFKRVILQALEDKYNAQISEAEALIKIYIQQPVGVGEHAQHIQEIDKQITKITEANEKLKFLDTL
jgi:hypothetical protein